MCADIDDCMDLQAEYYKKRLFYCVAGLDRGSGANSSAAAEVEAAVASLLAVSPPVLLSWAPGFSSSSFALASAMSIKSLNVS